MKCEQKYIFCFYTILLLRNVICKTTKPSKTCGGGEGEVTFVTFAPLIRYALSHLRIDGGGGRRGGKFPSKNKNVNVFYL